MLPWESLSVDQKQTTITAKTTNQNPTQKDLPPAWVLKIYVFTLKKFLEKHSRCSWAWEGRAPRLEGLLGIQYTQDPMDGFWKEIIEAAWVRSLCMYDPRQCVKLVLCPGKSSPEEGRVEIKMKNKPTAKRPGSVQPWELPLKSPCWKEEVWTSRGHKVARS